MAGTESDILNLLEKKPDGLEFAEVFEHLDRGDSALSQRGVRNLLNQMVKEGKLFKEKKRRTKGRGAPPYVYLHPEKVPRQLDLFKDIPGIDSERSKVTSRAKVDEEQLDPAERKRQDEARSVLKRIAQSHISSESHASAIINIAPKLAEENPVNLVLEMVKWAVKNLNQLGDDIERKWRLGQTEDVRKLSARLEERLLWTRSYFQRFWRLDRSVDEIPGILDLPAQARYFYRNGKRATLDEQKAEKRLKEKIVGNKFISERVPRANQHKAAAGTDASVADLFLAHNPGSFIPPDPVIVTSSAAAMVVNNNNGIPDQYLDFDIFPDQLRGYEDYDAAVNGLLLSPELMRPSGAADFKHSRMAAMELRQYDEDFRICTKNVNWRPQGTIPGDSQAKPTLMFRDGRVFPVVHRLNFYEADTLYGQIVRNQIEKFTDVIHNTRSTPRGEIIYGAAVKNPELSWLAPIVFWYLHTHPVTGEKDVDVDEVYRVPFADTAVSHLLFVGVAKQSKNFAPDQLLTTCSVIRRFSDIALVDTSLPAVILKDDKLELVAEDQSSDWSEFICQRIQKKNENYEENILDISDYEPFIYACAKVGVLMCYAAPASAYESIVQSESGGAAHFLIPRLEVAIDVEGKQNTSIYEKNLEKMLSWLVAENWERDGSHTQSAFDTGNGAGGLPILIPNVIYHAHEAATFARDKLSQEVQDEIKSLIAELRKRGEK